MKNGEPESNERLLFLTAASVEHANQLIQVAWKEQVLAHPEAVRLRWELRQALEQAEELERRAQNANIEARKPI